MKALTKQKLLTIVGMVVGLFIARAQPGMPLWTTLAMIGVLVIIPVFAILISSKYSSHIIKFGGLILGGGLVVSLHYSSTAAVVPNWNVVQTVRDGLRYVRADRAIVGTLAITVIMNLWVFPFAAMVPVIGEAELGLSAFPIGILMSAEGTGAFIGALLIANLARPAWFRRIYLSGSFLVGSMVVVFALSPWYGLSLALLFIAGLGAAGFSAMQTTMMFLQAPPEMRGRVMGVVSVCIGAGPLGVLHIGLLATWFDASTAVLIVAIEGLAALALARAYWPEIR